MKNIRYRGKRVDNNEWVSGFYLERTSNSETHSYIQYETWDEGFVTVEVIPQTVQRFTGLTDKNGSPIIEGDIIKVTDTYGDTYSTVVTAYGSTLCADVIGQDYDVTAIDFAVDLWNKQGCDYEVVGNSCNNPKLWEEENERI